jgi:hypothetical protein
MKSKQTDADFDNLKRLQTILIKELLARIESGEAKPADLAVARDMLRQNNIQVLPEASPEMVRLVEALPFNPADCKVG